MTGQDPGNSRAAARPDEELDESIDLLADLGEDPGPEFVERVRNKIIRRETAAQFTELSWFGLLAVAVEFARMAASPFANRSPTDEGSQ